MRPEPDDRTGDRLGAALGELAAAAERQLHAPGAAAAAAAGRRRRRRTLAAAGAVAVLAAGTAAGGWVLANRPAAEAAGCTEPQAAAFLPTEHEEEARDRVRVLLEGAPDVTEIRFETRPEAWERFKVAFRDAPDLVAATREENLPESWRFRLRCGADYPSLKRQLETVPLVTVVCTCEPPPSPTR